MATLNFPDAPDTGDIYTDSNSGFTYEWNGTVWISKDPSTAANIREIDNISSSFNGSTTAFTLQVAGVNVEPANVQQLIISVGGVMQNAGDDYTVSGSTLTFTTAPTSGLTFFGTLLGTALSLNTVADGSVTVSSLSTTTNYIMGGLTADQNAGFVTAYGLVAGAGGVNVSGAVTGGSFSGDGSGLTGVASTDNIITSYGATFLSNVRVAGIFTAANAYVTGILTAQTLNYNNVVDIYSTGIITATRGIQQTGNEGLHVSSGITTVGIFTATKSTVGLAVTINNTGVDAGIGAGIITAKEFYGSAANMTGIGITADVIAASPIKGSSTYSAVSPYDQISFNVNQGIQAGNPAKQIDIRHGSVTGNIIESFGVGSSVTYSFGQAIIQPTGIGITNEETYYVIAPDGAFEAVGGGNSTGIVNTYSFSTKDFSKERFAQGTNRYGAWGGNGVVGHNASRSSPVLVESGANNWAMLSGDNSTQANQFGIKDDGTLWGWGRGTYGQLGFPGSDRSSPTQVGTDTNWSVVTGAWLAGLAVKTDGTLWSWGYNGQGHLGQNNRTDYPGSPKQVGTDTTWNAVSGSETVICATKTNGTLWTWGRNNQGQLGLSDTNHRSSPTQVGTATDWERASSRNGVYMLASKNATAEVGRYLDKKGELWVWGQNTTGVLGLNNQTQYSSPKQLPGTTWDIVAPNPLSCNNVTVHTKSNGTLWTWGNGDEGGLGLGNRTNYSSPKQVGTETHWYSGINYIAQGKQGHQSAVTTDGKLFAWGNNQLGQMGNTHQGNLSSPTQIPGTFKLAHGGNEWLMEVSSNAQ